MGRNNLSVTGLSRSNTVALCIGVTFGVLISFFLANLSPIASLKYTPSDCYESFRSINNKRLITNRNHNRHVMASDKIIKPLSINDSDFHHDNDTVARKLHDKVRVLCWIMTSPENLDTKATDVKNTWAKRCNILIFFSSTTNNTFPTIGLNVSEGRDHLTAKTMQGFRYVYEHYKDEADWFMKADDDTYVILENLRYFLSGQITHNPVYFGHHLKPFVKQGYFSGGAGYVLSKEALGRLATKGNNPKVCRQDGPEEDIAMGLCMENLGVKTVKTSDALGRSRFHCLNPEYHLYVKYPDWYYQYDTLGAKQGIDSISDYAISFHYVTPEKMYALEFFIYHLRPYGIAHIFN